MRLRSDEHGRYRTPAEIALQNAADSLGVPLGEYYPEDAELPRALSEWGKEHPDSERLDASREEMLAYIDGLRAKRRRRRMLRWRAVGAAMVALSLVVAVLLLYVEDRGAGDDGPGGLSIAGGAQLDARWSKPSAVTATGLTVRSPRSTSAMVELPGEPMGRVASLYVDLTGRVCFKLDDVVDGVAKASSGGGCALPARIERQLRAEPVAITALQAGTREIILAGYARDSVRELSVLRPDSRGEIAISGAWKPDRRSDSAPIKLVLIRVPWKGSSDGAIAAVTRHERFELAAELDDGSVSRVRGWARSGRPPRLVDAIPGG